METLNCQFFRNKNACYDPADVLGDNWTGTIIDIMNHEKVPSKDKIWAACHVMTDKQLRLFAVRSVRQTPLKDGRVVVDLLEDQRSLNALDVAERFANGEATPEELAAAWAAARDAARAAARDAARAAARDAARAAARAAARDAARDAAWAAARDAARAAARAAAWDAARAAAWDAARDAARDAAWDAAWAAQVKIIIELLSE